MDLEIKKALREEFLKEWVNQATKEEIVKMLILNDDRAKRVNKALAFIDMDKHISCNWDNMTNKEKDEFVLNMLNELERILTNE